MIVDDAQRSLLSTLAGNPKEPSIWYKLGADARSRNELPRAVDYLRQALTLASDSPQIYSELAAALTQLNRDHEVIAMLQYAVDKGLGDAKLYFQQGICLQNLGRNREAIQYLERAIALDPDFADAYDYLGAVYTKLKMLSKAAGCFRQVIRLQPNNAAAYYKLAVVSGALFDYELAQLCYARAIELNPNQFLWKLEKDILMPAVMQDSDSIQNWRLQVESAIGLYTEGSFKLAQWLPEILKYNLVYLFNLAYHGLDDRPLKERYCNIFSALGSEQRPILPTTEYRIGFVVTKGHEGLFLRFLTGVCDNLAENFLVTVIAPPGSEEFFRASFARQIDIIALESNILTDIQRIRAKRLHLVYYWEVGTDTLNFILPLCRLAPVQCTSWGTAETTGMKAIDYFVSSQLFEPMNAELHYTEQLVCLNSQGVYFRPPDVAGLIKPRATYGYSESDHLYFCAQNLLKLHPDFDHILAQILRRDSRGIVLVKLEPQALNEVLVKRWRSRIPDVVDRIKPVPNQSYENHLNLMKVSDVLLDTIHYSGGTTGFEAIAVGTPVVTWPGEFMRGRMTYGCYQKIGVLDTVVWSAEEYAAKAVQIASNRDYQHYLRQKILASNHLLFEDINAVRELEMFFKRAIDKALPK